MKTLKRIISALRVWLGWNDPSENHLSPAHGWLLPAPSAGIPPTRDKGLRRE
jgi:hypothetical protein